MGDVPRTRPPSLSGLTGDLQRREVVRQTFALIATALLRDKKPRDQDLALLAFAFVEAAIAGDRALLHAGAIAVERLQRYLPRERYWFEELHGRLWSLRLVIGGLLFFLDQEAKTAD